MSKDGPVKINVRVSVDSNPSYNGDTLSSVSREVTVAGSIGANMPDVIQELTETLHNVGERVALELDAQAALARVQAENAGDGS